MSATLADRLDAIERRIDAASTDSLHPNLFTVSGGLLLQSDTSGIDVKQAPYSAVGDGVADDTGALSSAIQAAQGANTNVVLPPGNYKITSALPVLGNCRGILGAGRRVTTITPASDFGAGIYIIDCDTRPYTNNKTHVLAGFTIAGNTAPWGPGATMWAVNGVRFGSCDLGLNLEVKGVQAGFTIAGDHNTLLHCCGELNNYPLRHTATLAHGLGNNTFVSCKFSGPAFASVSVASGSSTQYDHYAQCHFGFGPYGLYKEAGANKELFIDGCTFTQCFFESIGNGYIYDNSGVGQVSNNLWLDCPTTPWPLSGDVRTGNTYSIQANVADWVLDVGYLVGNNRVYGGGPFAAAGNKGLLRARKQITDWHHDDAQVAIDNIQQANVNKAYAAGTASVLVYAACDTAGGMSQVRCRYFTAECRVLPCSTTVDRYDAVYSSSVAQTEGISRAGTHAIVGVAQSRSNSTLVAGGVPVVVDGESWVNTDASGFTGGPFVKPSGGAGAVVAATSAADSSLGYWQGGQSAAARFPIPIVVRPAW